MMRIIAFISLLLLSACQKESPNTLVIGTIAGPETELVEIAAQVAEHDDGLHIKIVEFNDYNLPNQALNDGSLDVNVYQHAPYLKAAIAAHHYQLVAVGKTFLYPIGLYSRRIHALDELPQRAIIALPNDPSNQTRALKLLAFAHLIRLNDSNAPGIHDILDNPHQFRFKELDAAILPHTLQDVDAAVINTNFAIPAGLNPARDALLLEDRQSPYANLIVMKQGSSKQIQIKQFVHALHSEPVMQRARELFPGAALPAWK